MIIYASKKTLGHSLAGATVNLIAKRIAGKFLSRLLPVIGWGGLALDVLSLAGEATRVTGPLVSMICFYREIERK